MMEYKVLTERGGAFKETASQNLEATLNAHAAEGWRVVNSMWLTESSSIVTAMERDDRYVRALAVSVKWKARTSGVSENCAPSRI